ncbi:biotin--[acetyl-CoA-carboxylase] ligase [Roseateles saccharophilus]|uniref:biotin--[biotin carboxyl-carrier protein] ligase n=1 Tax=Roseateles saccharophilus TaxID=304 RepID=A0A4R3UIP2_ROSSA|nr:biotin--[acetyl-CoA-carboxylase] ligase [Roseateles saccharophilus]MDG0834207.1 biotin--[acetyl-CoA-carboxylase] ligase [Roseateles saccharophilus]TCU89931.1 BirA family biotin operon repressor/biotin-[acetyl-CoA-carboxylase] ligase [Roseateles saccharophilus]
MVFVRKHLAECGSTNTEALAHLRDGGGPLLLSAARQTAGRGRLGRAWQSDDSALTFSVALPLPAELDLSGLSLAVGCSVADVLDPAGQRIRLKWPNDLFLDGAKLGGILIEAVPLPAQLRGVVIGIGINLLPLPPEADRSAFASGHAALQALDPAATAQATLDRLAPALQGLLADFRTLGFGPWQLAFSRRDLAAGQRVRVGERTGIARGVSTRGELLLDTDAGMAIVSAGELSLRLETSP